MKMQEVRTKARGLGIKPGKMKKTDLIHKIQKAEGYEPCFGRSGGTCSHVDCSFFTDCMKLA